MTMEPCTAVWNRMMLTLTQWKEIWIDVRLVSIVRFGGYRRERYGILGGGGIKGRPIGGSAFGERVGGTYFSVVKNEGTGMLGNFVHFRA
jgi:hypothetical protein